MGMSAFGKPKYVDRIYELIKVNSNGSFRLNMKYFLIIIQQDTVLTKNLLNYLANRGSQGRDL